MKIQSHVYFIYQTKLFFYREGFMTQWDLLTMTQMQYYLVNDVNYRGDIDHYSYSIVINKNQTLLALVFRFRIDIFSMETGILISSYEG